MGFPRCVVTDRLGKGNIEYPWLSLNVLVHLLVVSSDLLPSVITFPISYFLKTPDGASWRSSRPMAGWAPPSHLRVSRVNVVTDTAAWYFNECVNDVTLSSMSSTDRWSPLNWRRLVLVASFQDMTLPVKTACECLLTMLLYHSIVSFYTIDPNTSFIPHVNVLHLHACRFSGVGMASSFVRQGLGCGNESWYCRCPIDVRLYLWCCEWTNFPCTLWMS